MGLIKTLIFPEKNKKNDCDIPLDIKRRINQKKPKSNLALPPYTGRLQNFAVTFGISCVPIRPWRNYVATAQ